MGNSPYNSPYVTFFVAVEHVPRFASKYMVYTGASVGVGVGAAVVGAAVVGAAVVGAAVVGATVGASVGAAVGASVGATVGATVASGAVKFVQDITVTSASKASFSA